MSASGCVSKLPPASRNAVPTRRSNFSPSRTAAARVKSDRSAPVSRIMGARRPSRITGTMHRPSATSIEMIAVRGAVEAGANLARPVKTKARLPTVAGTCIVRSSSCLLSKESAPMSYLCVHPREPALIALHLSEAGEAGMTERFVDFRGNASSHGQ
jgi:hypothetical protein